MNYTITTPLYYVNDKAHLGSTYTTIASDAFARYQRLEGNNVTFITGVDEHGQKIQRTAYGLGISPRDHCDMISQQYKQLWDKWGISNDRFVRTTSNQHKELVHVFFNRVNNSGDIYLGQQQGWYCVGCEEYKETDPGIKDPFCSLHKNNLEWRDEVNLFFKLSKFQKEIEILIDTPGFIQPTSRKNEICNFVSQGLKDFSISRIDVPWGIPVPGYQGHTFYVWFDALVGYLSALVGDKCISELEELHDLGWPASVHIIGKDILRFHAVYWPAMLISAGLKLPKRVFGHGFLTREGQKMGKSLGNVLDPNQLLDEFGTDAIRWYLLKDIQFGNDGDFQNKRFHDLVNNDLANTIGNLLNRTISMSRKWFSDKVPPFSPIEKMSNSLELCALKKISLFRKSIDQLEFHIASQAILDLAINANGYLNEKAPWKLMKDINNLEVVANDLYSVLETCRIIGLLLNPILPELSNRILVQLSCEDDLNSWSDNLNWGMLISGKNLPIPTPVIHKIESY